MHATVVRTRGGEITIRPLRSGDTSVICGIFGRMGPQSRRLRFGATSVRVGSAVFGARG